jgi:uroporphyrinogen III methyltransferase/synthase
MKGAQVLIPRAAEARDVLPEGLKQMGAVVNVLPVYDTVFDGSGSEGIVTELRAGTVDAVTFTSSSTVSNFILALGNPPTDTLRDYLAGVTVAAIGPITADTLREFGIEPDVCAAEHTIPGLVAALNEHFTAQQPVETGV